MFRTSNFNLSIIKEMELRAVKIPGVVSLAQGIPSFDTPAPIKRVAREMMEKGKVAKYSLTNGLPELRECAERYLAAEGMNYDYETEIIVTAGVAEGVSAVLQAILDEGDEVLIPNPTYAAYPIIIRVAHGKPVWVDLDEEKGWAFNLEAFRRAVTPKTKAVLFCNPNNPTGTVFTKKQLLDLAELAEEHNFYILSDEVYKDFIFDSSEPYFSLAQETKYRKRVIRFFGFSKAYAMTGWRVGFLHTDAEIAGEILKVHDSLVTCAPVISQYGAIAALEECGEEVKEFCRAYKSRRDLICSHLDSLARVFTYSRPNSAYFVFPKIKINHNDSRDFAVNLLERVKVATVPGIGFGPAGEGHIRMSFGRSEEDIDEAFIRLEEYFK